MASYCFLLHSCTALRESSCIERTVYQLLAAGHCVHIGILGQMEALGLKAISPLYTESCIGSDISSQCGTPVYGHKHELLSYAVHTWLKGNTFDCVCISAVMGIAFHVLQARKVCGMYERTAFTIVTEEKDEILFPCSPFSAARLQFCKEYCACNADIKLNQWIVVPIDNKRVFTKTVSKIKSLVTICVTHHNHAAYLPMALHSLAGQVYPNFEVVVVDDGSTDPCALAEFARQEKVCDSRFRFFRKKNSGPGLTRNFCAEKAKGEYLIFFDSDNVAPPFMVSRFVEAMQHSGMDALTCHFSAFAPDASDASQLKFLYTSMPVGPDVVTGLLENCFGDTNMIIKAEVFKALGGMCDTRQGVEDWELLARLSLKGYRMDVVPEVLFYYRLTQGGLSRNNSALASRQCIVRAYADALGPLGERIVSELLLPLYIRNIERCIDTNGSVILEWALRTGMFFEKWWQKLFPPQSIHGRIVSRLRRLVAKKL